MKWQHSNFYEAIETTKHKNKDIRIYEFVNSKNLYGVLKCLTCDILQLVKSCQQNRKFYLNEILLFSKNISRIYVMINFNCGALINLLIEIRNLRQSRLLRTGMRLREKIKNLFVI